MTPNRFTGGCECGVIRHECAAAPIVMFNCHCRECQKVTGGPYVPVVVVPADAFGLTRGALRYHFTPSEMMGRQSSVAGGARDGVLDLVDVEGLQNQLIASAPQKLDHLVAYDLPRRKHHAARELGLRFEDRGVDLLPCAG